MKEFGSDKVFAILAFVISLVFLSFFHMDALIHPDSYLFSTAGDGIKNYYTFAYHIQKDSSMGMFEGMGYPYTDHVAVYDSQPAISNIIKLLKPVLPGLGEHSVGVMNLLMLLSLPFTALLLFLIFRIYGVGKGYALACGVAMALLSPQIMRFMFHYGLAYSCCIPLGWYLFLRFQHSERYWKWTFFLGFNTFFWFFVHPYLGAILTLFIGLLFFLSWVIPPYDRYWWRSAALFAVYGVLPLVLFQGIMILTDPYGGRPSEPFGIYEYTASWKGILLPFHNYFPVIREYFEFNPGSRERLSYLGVSAMIFLVILVVVALKEMIMAPFQKGKSFPLTGKALGWEKWSLLVIGFFFLGLSLGFPFHQFPGILDLVPALHNFRALGRFAWVGYFMINGVGFYFFWKVMEKWRSGGGKGALLSQFFFLFPLLLIIETIPYHQKLSERMQKSKNLFDEEQLPAHYGGLLEHIEPSTYQAILPLPFYMAGAEYFMAQQKGPILGPSQVISYHTGLPIIGGVYRAPVKNAIKMINFTAPWFYEKAIQADFPEEKPILIMATGGLNQYEKKWTQRAQEVYQGKDIWLGKIPLNEFFKSRKKELLAKFHAHQRDSLKEDRVIFRDDMEGHESPVAFYGKGAYRGEKTGYNSLWEEKSHNLDPEKEYRATYWVFHDYKKLAHAMTCLEEFNPKTENGTWDYCTDPRFSRVIDGQWVKVELPFHVRKKGNNLKLFLKGMDRYKGDTITIDEVLVRPADKDVFEVLSTDSSGTPQELYFNGHFIDLTKYEK